MLINKIERVAKQYKNKIAIVYEDENITYAQLMQKATDIAIYILKFEEKNNRRITNCGLLFSQEIDGIATMLGCLLAGVTYVPLDANNPTERIREMIKYAEIDLVIASKEVKTKFIDDVTVVEVNKIENTYEEDVLKKKRHSTEITYILFTSGTTGKPKAVKQNEKAIYHYVSEYMKIIGLTADDNMTLLSSFGHDASIIDIYSGLLSGATLFINNMHKVSNFLTLSKWLSRYEITVWHSVPTLYRQLWKNLHNRMIKTKLRVVVLGGELPRKVDFDIQQKLFQNAKLYILYGQTEASFNSGVFIESEKDIGSLGNPISEVKLLKVKNKKLYLLGKEELFEFEDEIWLMECEENELVICSEYVANGYLKNEEETCKCFFTDSRGKRYYRTGDLVNEEEATDKIIGRADRQVKIRGYRVEVSEIEDRLEKFHNVQQCVIMPLEVGEYTKLVAVMVSSGDVSLQDVNNYLERFMPRYVILYKLVITDKLPLTSSGKIDYKAVNNICISALKEEGNK